MVVGGVDIQPVMSRSLETPDFGVFGALCAVLVGFDGPVIPALLQCANAMAAMKAVPPNERVTRLAPFVATTRRKWPRNE